MAPDTDEIATSMRTYVASSELGGRGVFAAEAILEGDVVEVAPVMTLPADELDHLNGTSLRDHWYGWGDDGRAAIGLGHASLYNHAADPTCDFETHETMDAIVFVARRDIEADEELTIDYTGGGVNPLWFDSADP